MTIARVNGERDKKSAICLILSCFSKVNQRLEVQLLSEVELLLEMLNIAPNAGWINGQLGNDSLEVGACWTVADINGGCSG